MGRIPLREYLIRVRGIGLSRTQSVIIIRGRNRITSSLLSQSCAKRQRNSGVSLAKFGQHDRFSQVQGGHQESSSQLREVVLVATTDLLDQPMGAEPL